MSAFSHTGVATGIGSMPGTHPLDAARLVADELPDLPHLVELPARGPGADLVGRGAALLVELPVDLQPAGWRLVDRPGADHRRAVALLRQDLDVLEEVLDGYVGPVKLQAAGPLTLAASVEKTRGDKVLADHGARRDLAESLAEGLRGHVDEVRRRVPGAEVVLQLDEPSLPAVLAGGVPTVSGFGRLRAVDEPAARSLLELVITAADAPVVVHCCAPEVPVRLLRDAGADALALDVSIFPRTSAHDEALAEAVEAGVVVVAGVVPTGAAAAAEVSDLRERVVQLWRRLDQPLDRLGAGVLVSPACGLAGASPAYARDALRRARQVASSLAEG